MSLVEKINNFYSQYLKKFEPRDDLSKFTPTDNSILQYNEWNASQSENAYADLEIENVAHDVVLLAPFEKRRATDATRNTIEKIFHNPTTNISELFDRQEVILELYSNPDLMKQFSSAKIAGDDFKYDERFRDHPDWITQLEKSKLLVNFFDSVLATDDVKSKRLNKIKSFAKNVNEDSGYKKVHDFIKDIYEPNDLGDVFAVLTHSLNHDSLYDVDSRRSFFAKSKILRESLDVLFNDNKYEGFVNKEINEVKILDSFDNKVKEYNSFLFKFKEGLREFQNKHNDDFGKLVSYLGEVLTEGISSKMGKLGIGDIPELLGFYIGAAKLAKSWENKKAPVVVPELLEKNVRITKIIDAYNTTLLAQNDAGKIIPNDIISDPKTNLFVIEGPNNGGKTTYLRHVGQMYWLTQLGMMIPAKEAKISVVDGIYTSIGAEDDTDAGTGQYLTELNRVCEFTKPSNGHMRTTPYSLLFFDEFANGTDHDEAVYRTRIVLDHLSMKGVTAYFTTHKHEIGKMVEDNLIPGAMNLAAEAKFNGELKTTHKILRNTREKSYGNVIAENLGITEDNLKSFLNEELAKGHYSINDTRLGGE